jgi:serine/threonine protein kinase
MKPRSPHILKRVEVALERPRQGPAILRKVAYSDDPSMRALLGRTILAEKLALRVLSGLAVPRLLAEGGGPSGSVSLARSFVRGHTLDRLVWAPQEAIGLWLFIVGQLEAFRRRGILCTDLKPANLVGSKRPPAVVFIDLDGAIPLRRSDRYPASEIRCSPGFVPPEARLRDSLGESAVVFQAGLVLGSLLSRINGVALEMDRPRALRSVRSRIAGHASGRFAALLEKTLESSPSRRVPTVAALARAIRRLGRDAVSAASWSYYERLQRPYARLAEAFRG